VVEDFIHLVPHKYRHVRALKIAEWKKNEAGHFSSTSPSL